MANKLDRRSVSGSAVAAARDGSPVGRLRDGFADQLRFLRNWASDPLKVGAIAPSGRGLARAMASFVDPASTAPVLELGPGTGVVTEALIERGVAPDRIVSVEYNAEFCTLLRRRIPGVRFIQGDAYAVDGLLNDLDLKPFGSVVSSLPLFTRPEADREALVRDTLERTAPDGLFIQFSYAWTSPVKPSPTLAVDRTGWIWCNVPPARVWTFRRAG